MYMYEGCWVGVLPQSSNAGVIAARVLYHYGQIQAWSIIRLHIIISFTKNDYYMLYTDISYTQRQINNTCYTLTFLTHKTKTMFSTCYSLI